MRQLLNRLYWTLQKRIAPNVRPAVLAYEEALDSCVTPETDWLDLGCGWKVLPTWRFDKEKELVARAKSVTGIDCEAASLTKHRTITNLFYGDVANLPFADASFDLVTANMVVEHLSDPIAQFREIRRVLRPGGTFLFHTPNRNSYLMRLANILPDSICSLAARFLEGRSASDVFPTHYRANTEPEILDVARATGFSSAEIKMVVSDASFQVIPPVLVAELLWLRRLARESHRSHRTNIIAKLA
jgi:ubiquinone/menaquinone biosynthesis C-methylase UbiE